MNITELRDKKVLAEFRLGRRWHFRSVGSIRVHVPNDSCSASVELVMPTAYPKPGREFRVIALTDEQVKRLRPANVVTHDYVYEGVLLNDDESEDTSACARPPEIIG